MASSPVATSTTLGHKTKKDLGLMGGDQMAWEGPDTLPHPNCYIWEVPIQMAASCFSGRECSQTASWLPKWLANDPRNRFC